MFDAQHITFVLYDCQRSEYRFYQKYVSQPSEREREIWYGGLISEGSGSKVSGKGISLQIHEGAFEKTIKNLGTPEDFKYAELHPEIHWPFSPKNTVGVLEAHQNISTSFGARVEIHLPTTEFDALKNLIDEALRENCFVFCSLAVLPKYKMFKDVPNEFWDNDFSAPPLKAYVLELSFSRREIAEERMFGECLVDQLIADAKKELDRLVAQAEAEGSKNEELPYEIERVEKVLSKLSEARDKSAAKQAIDPILNLKKSSGNALKEMPKRDEKNFGFFEKVRRWVNS